MIQDNNQRVNRNKDYINVKVVMQNLYKVNIKHTSMLAFDVDLVSCI